MKFVVTARSDSPSVVGWLRPVVLLPAAALAGLSEQQLECILAHELAHIRRHDYLVNLVQNIVETLLFYHPAVWWTSSRVRHERELCCDDFAVRSCGDAVRYARALTALEKMRDNAPALAMAGTGGSLLYRVRRLMGVPANETAPSRMAAIAALLLGVACLALNTNWAKAQEQSVPGILGFAYIQDGPGVQVDLGGAAIAERVGIEYPGSAWEHQIGGLVVAEATLNSDGAVTDARILSGPGELRKAVLQSLLEWRFAAAPAGATRQVSVNFQWQQAEQQHEKEETNRVVLSSNGLTYEFRVSKTSGTIGHSETTAREPGSSRVAHIEFSGLTQEQMKGISERFPVHLGETLSETGQSELIRALSSADPPLSIAFGRDENDQLIIRITPAK